MNDTVIVAFVGFLAGVIGSFVSFKIQKPLSDANSAAIIQKASTDLLLPYQARVKELEDKVAEFEHERIAWAQERQELINRLQAWELGIGRLIAQIGRMGETPEWTPTGETPQKPQTKPLSGHGFRA